MKKKYRTIKTPSHCDKKKLKKAYEAALSLKTIRSLKPKYLEKMGVIELAAAFSNIRNTENANLHLAAEIAFALAKFHYDEGNVATASDWKRRALDLVREWTEKEGDSYETCASSCRSILGVSIPGLLHEGTIKRELKDIQDRPSPRESGFSSILDSI